jgi:hypothetical protein
VYFPLVRTNLVEKERISVGAENTLDHELYGAVRRGQYATRQGARKGEATYACRIS